MLAGIQFEMDKDWHIYWKNPGDSGEPPRITWRLPEGVRAGPLQWPSPLRLKTSAGTDYGYEGPVVLLSTLQIPAAAQSGTTMEVAGDLRWLVCHDICIPQRAELKAPVRVGNANHVNDDVHTVLVAAASRVPKPMPASLHASAVSSPGDFQLLFLANEQIGSAEFFPAEPEQVNDSAPQEIAVRSGVARLELKESDHLIRVPERLRGVLVLNGHEAYEIDLPIQHSTGQKGSHP